MNTFPKTCHSRHFTVLEVVIGCARFIFWSLVSKLSIIMIFWQDNVLHAWELSGDDLCSLPVTDCSSLLKTETPQIAMDVCLSVVCRSCC